MASIALACAVDTIGLLIASLSSVMDFTRCEMAVHSSSSGEGCVAAMSEADKASIECRRNSNCKG